MSADPLYKIFSTTCKQSMSEITEQEKEKQKKKQTKSKTLLQTHL